MAFIANAGINLHYERTGNGQPIVFLHTWLTTHLFWKDQVTALRRQHQVVTIDLRGHGESSKPRGAYTTSILTRDVKRVIDGLNLNEAILVGWGFGGLIALGYVRQFPARVRGLVLVGVNPKTVADADYDFGIGDDQGREALKELDKDYRSFLRSYAGRLFRSGAKPELLSWAGAEASKTPPHAARAMGEVLFESDEREGLADLTCHTLVCHGKHDQVSPVGAGEYLGATIPKAEFKLFEESGHALQIEEAARFNEELLAFTESLP